MFESMGEKHIFQREKITASTQTQTFLADVMGISKILDILVSGVHTHIPLFDQHKLGVTSGLMLILVKSWFKLQT